MIHLPQNAWDNWFEKAPAFSKSAFIPLLSIQYFSMYLQQVHLIPENCEAPFCP